MNSSRVRPTSARIDLRAVLGWRLLAVLGPLALTAAVSGAVSAPKATLTASSSSNAGGAAFTALIPTRLLDTRSTGAPFGAGGTINLTVTGTAGVASDATAVALNVTVTDTTSASYLSLYPTGGARGSISNLNWVAGETVANSAIVPVGSAGQVSIYNHTGRTDVVVDVDGYFAPVAPGASAGAYVPLAPVRIADTRAGSGLPDANSTLRSGGTLNVQVSGQGGVPAEASAAILNVTATDTTSSSYLTVFPQGASPPNASNLNWVSGATVANRVLVPLSSSGQITVFNHAGAADVVVDVDGFFTNGTSTLPANASLYTAVTPVRLLDTRAGSGYPGAGITLSPGSTLPVAYSLLPTGVTAVVENLTAADTTAASFFTVFPGGGTRPTSSDLNWTVGQVVANLTVATLSGHEETDIYNHAGEAQAIVDAFGYFSLYTPAVPPTVSGINPSSGPPSGGTVVTITGTGFSTTAGTTSFDFGTGHAATAVTCTSSTSCTATAPAGSGTVDVTATVAGLTSAISSADQFTYTSQLAFTTEPSDSATSGAAFAIQPVVSVDDSTGSVITGNSSTVTLSVSPSSGALSCTGGDSAAAVSGVATFRGCEITGPEGDYTLTAADGALAPASSTPIALGQAVAAQLVFNGEPPSTASSGTPFGSVSVSVEDGSGHVVTSDSSTVTLSLTPAGGGLSCSSTNHVQASSGVATFSGCDITGPAGSYTLTAGDSNGSVAGATSSAITLGAGAAGKLMFTGEPPSTASSGTPFGSGSVSVEDAAGNVVTTDNSTVTLTLSSGSTAGGALTCSGSDSVAASSGVANLSGCEITGPPGEYTITASDGSLTTAVSDTITLSAGTATQLVFTFEPPSSFSSSSGTPFPVSVSVEDASGNVLTSDNSSTVDLTISVTAGDSVSCSGGSSMTVTAGVANFSSCGITGTIGNNDYITATDSTYPTLTGTSTQVTLTT
jgi:hypothetical protein